jgi:hypothetical protein
MNPAKAIEGLKRVNMGVSSYFWGFVQNDLPEALRKLPQDAEIPSGFWGGIAFEVESISVTYGETIQSMARDPHHLTREDIDFLEAMTGMRLPTCQLRAIR